MTSIKVHAAPRDIIKEAVGKMDAILASYAFTDARIKAAATRFVERYRNSRANSLGHTVGHGGARRRRARRRRSSRGASSRSSRRCDSRTSTSGIRLEDMILITETGYENLSAFVPIEIADIEKLMARAGDAKEVTVRRTTGVIYSSSYYSGHDETDARRRSARTTTDTGAMGHRHWPSWQRRRRPARWSAGLDGRRRKCCWRSAPRR